LPQQILRHLDAIGNCAISAHRENARRALIFSFGNSLVLAALDFNICQLLDERRGMCAKVIQSSGPVRYAIDATRTAILTCTLGILGKLRRAAPRFTPQRTNEVSTTAPADQIHRDCSAFNREGAKACGRRSESDHGYSLAKSSAGTISIESGTNQQKVSSKVVTYARRENCRLQAAAR
jgi:hypothetical protein